MHIGHEDATGSHHGPDYFGRLIIYIIRRIECSMDGMNYLL